MSWQNYNGPSSRGGYTPEEPSSRSSTMSRPSAKSIYMQRKTYSESVTKQPDNFQHRVEHLITSDLDGQTASTVEDCLGSLKTLTVKGKVWAQDMLMEVRGSTVQLSDIETKVALDSLPLGSIMDMRAISDALEDYSSILTITVNSNPRNPPQVFMFQCTEAEAPAIKEDLDKAIQRGGNFEPDPYAQRDFQRDIRNDLENIIGQQQRPGSFRSGGSTPMMPDRDPSPPQQMPPQWNNYDQQQQEMPPPMFGHDGQQPPWQEPEPQPPQYDPMYEQQPPPQPPAYSDTDRNVEILNHVLNDTEMFMGQVSAASPPSQEDKGKKKKKKKEKEKKNMGPMLPPVEEYFSFLQKVKYGFNLLGKLNGVINNPGAPDLVHAFFSMLAFVVPRYPPDVPPNVLPPFLTEEALQLMSQVVTPEEGQLWGSLGDCWSTPRHAWPDGDQFPPYTPMFYDGWEVPPPVENSQPPWQQARGGSQRQSQRFMPNDDMQMQQPPPNQDQMGWNSPPQRSAEPLLQMQVIYDFMARNSQELSVMKGDVVQVVDKSKQWWKVRNVRDEEGHVPQNVLQPMDEPRDMRGPPTLNMSSTPVEVRAWLEYKGFSRLTVRSLSVLNGEMLLKMTRDEIRMVAPEEGAKVFFQLQAVKSSLALADEGGFEPSYHNGY
ncbi:epidermal growth factor receptor kinase substrate 8-like protein 3b [Engraulis encrasicolus]|uniref:epidermal growth factor receptor kinase substrate 8-like protein 3b n=1 Tax=Engraulis encrasicolus TaxID=184585 RepID=UPI002FCEDC1E